MNTDRILIPCRVCGKTPEQSKRINTILVEYITGRQWPLVIGLKNRDHGRWTRFKCSCGISGPETLRGARGARSAWNDENLDAHLKRQLIETQKQGA